MMTIELGEIFSDRHLAVREASYRLRGPLEGLDSNHLVLDFSGIRGVSPSFLDEMMAEITTLPQANEWLVVEFRSAPMERTGTIERIIEGRGGTLEAIDGQQWKITFGSPPRAPGFWADLRERLFS